MRLISVAVCDDEELLAQLLAQMIRKAFYKNNVFVETDVFSSLQVLERRMKAKQYEILFLDIDMATTDGIEFGKSLREVGYQGNIVYVSSHEDRVFDSFDVHPYSFIRKASFQQEIEKVAARYVEEELSISYKNLVQKSQDGSMISIPISQIIYIESDLKFQKIFLLDKQDPVRVRNTLNALEEELENRGFVRAHKAFLVNSRYIRRINANSVDLADGSSIPVGRSRAKQFVNDYLRFMA